MARRPAQYRREFSAIGMERNLGAARVRRRCAAPFSGARDQSTTPAEIPRSKRVSSASPAYRPRHDSTRQVPSTVPCPAARRISRATQPACRRHWPCTPDERVQIRSHAPRRRRRRRRRWRRRRRRTVIETAPSRFPDAGCRACCRTPTEAGIPSRTALQFPPAPAGSRPSPYRSPFPARPAC